MKGPLNQDAKTIVLKVLGFKELLDKKFEAVDVQFGGLLNFREDNRVFVVSDVALNGDTLYISTKCKKQNCSAVWKIEAKGVGINSQPELVHYFKDKGLEGLAVTPEQWLWGVFDNGSDPGQYFKVRL